MTQNIPPSISKESHKIYFEFAFYFTWTLVVLIGLYYIPRRVDPDSIGITLIVHICTSSIALLIGPFQFSKTIRRRWRGLHRMSGWTYIGCVLISAPTSYVLAIKGSCQQCVPSYFIWATLCMFVTAMGVLMAIQRKFAIHKQFMIRSYVLMNVFFFIRIDNLIPFPLPEGLDINRRSMVLWIVWVIPLLITEFWLSWLPALRGKVRRVS